MLDQETKIELDSWFQLFLRWQSENENEDEPTDEPSLDAIVEAAIIRTRRDCVRICRKIRAQYHAEDNAAPAGSKERLIARCHSITAGECAQAIEETIL